MEGEKKDLPEIKYLLVLDFEATCQNNSKPEPCPQIIEFPVIVVNTWTLQIQDQFHQYVKPRFNPQLTNFCTQLTGITQETVDKGKHIEYVLDDFYKWKQSLKYLEQGNFTFVTCGDWDLNNCLRKESKAKALKVPQYLKKYINIKKYFVKVMNWKQNSKGMMEMLEVLKIKHEGKHHSGIDDVKNICSVCIELIKSKQAKFPKSEIVQSKYYSQKVENKQGVPHIKYLLVLDFEATCENNAKLEPCSQIIEFPVMVLNTQTLQIQDQFHQYVKPKYNPQLTKFCTQLTGITQEMVDKGKHIEYVLDDFQKWKQSLKYLEQGNFTFVTCGDWDLNNCLRKQANAKNLKISNHFSKYINLKSYFVKVMNWKQKSRGMMQMLQTLKVKHEGKHHSGIDDVKNICNICIELIKSRKAQFPKNQIIEMKF